MTKSLIELSAEIIASQARNHTMSSDDMSQGLRTIFQTLQELHQAHEVSASSDSDTANSLAYLRQHPLESIQRHQVICLESGKAYKLLSNRHLMLHGLTPREYKRKWGFPLGTALSARTLTARRRKLAKQLGMGKALAEWRSARKQAAGSG